MKRVTVELERYVPASEVFRLAAKKPDCAFLDSSLVNELGRWSILGLRPYKTRPMHGKVTRVHHRGTGLFAGLPEEFNVTRYHSLVVREDTLPADYQVDCIADDGTVMALSHRTLPMYGVQFHPEAVLTEYGHEMLENFCRMAEEKGVPA